MTEGIDLADYQKRFGGIARLYGVDGLERIQNAHVAIIGIGGVGSWSAEALARSGVGKLTLVDLDEVCVSNINRQLHALNASVGQSKCDVMAARISEINPSCQVVVHNTFFTERTAQNILSSDLNAVIDAIDNRRNKAKLIDECYQRKIPVIVSGGGGGQIDPTRVQSADLTKAFNDPLLALIRKELRHKYNYPRDLRKKWKIDCVFSDELPVYPQSDGSVCSKKEIGSSLQLNCESGYGSASFVTGTMGFVAAQLAIKAILKATVSASLPRTP